MHSGKVSKNRQNDHGNGYGFTGLIGRLSGSADHPPFEPGELGRGRRAVAWLCLILFVLLFMPTPHAVY